MAVQRLWNGFCPRCNSDGENDKLIDVYDWIATVSFGFVVTIGQVRQ